MATGDEKTAVENVRRFFEQYFHESNDSCAIPCQFPVQQLCLP